MINDAEKYMQMALNLAKRGIGSVEPNPAVGAVIIKANQIIGTGWHKKFGGTHAEINALEDCKSLAVNPRGATMFVTLEPCSHEGKTGPCTQVLIEAGIAKIFIATKDPCEHANGKGIEQLKEAGIEVQTGICENQAKLLNAPFFKFNTTGKTWVTLKWAQTIDGSVADKSKSDAHRWISNSACRREVHKLRRRCQAILVGINTVIADDPLLTARPSRGTKATRIVLDSFLRISPNCKLLKTAKQNPVIIYANKSALETKSWLIEKINKAGGEVVTYPDTYGGSNLHYLLDELGKRGIAQLLVEGGPTVLTSFLKEDLADEVYVYIASKIFGNHSSLNISEPMAHLSRYIALKHVNTKNFSGDIRIAGFTEKALKELLYRENFSHLKVGAAQ